MPKTLANHEKQLDVRFTRFTEASSLEIHWSGFKTTIGTVYLGEIIEFCLALLEGKESHRLMDDYYEATTVLEFHRSTTMHHIVEIQIYELNSEGKRIPPFQSDKTEKEGIRFDAKFKTKARDFAGLIYFELEKIRFLRSEKRRDPDFPSLEFTKLQKTMAEKYGSIDYNENSKIEDNFEDPEWNWPNN